MYIRILELACMNIAWRWREWRQKPTDLYVDLAQVNDCNRK